jgi:rhodanese-related sulfurtransferase
MDEIRRIIPEDVMRRLARREPLVFVDARRPDAWASSERRIVGAVRILPDQVDDSAGRLPRGVPLVVYCTCPDEKSSARVAQRLMELGFGDAQALLGGFSAWEEAGYPTEPKTHAAPEAPRPTL